MLSQFALWFHVLIKYKITLTHQDLYQFGYYLLISSSL